MPGAQGEDEAMSETTALRIRTGERDEDAV